MTLILSDRYPGQIVTTDPAYPLGKARNRTSPTDGSGTPYEADLVNDLHGTLQAILDAGGVTPSGDPDEVGASDVVDALTALFANRCGTFLLEAGTPYLDVVELSSGASPGAGDYTIVGGNAIQVPVAGQYRVEWGVALVSSSTANPVTVQCDLSVGAVLVVSAEGIRYSATATQRVPVARSHIVEITTPASERIQLSLATSNGTPSLSGDASLHYANVTRVT